METTGMQHVAARSRVYTKLSPFPHPSGFRRYFDYVMYGVGTLAPIALVPQVTEIYQTQSAAGFALSTWSSLMVINFLWMIYASLHKERAVLLANAGMLLMNTSVVFGIFLFG